MGLLDDYSGAPGLGMAPRPARAHQIAMSNLHINLTVALPKSKFIVLTEDAIYKAGRKDRAPDIVVYEKLQNGELKAVMFIEINDHKRLPKLLARIHEVMRVAEVTEAFLYRYDLGTWQKFSTRPAASASHSYSDVLRLDLSAMAK